MGLWCSASTPMIASLLKKPESGGRPDKAAAAKVMHTIGTLRPRPPYLPISKKSLVSYSWMKTPEHRKSRALKPAWVVR